MDTWLDRPGVHCCVQPRPVSQSPRARIVRNDVTTGHVSFWEEGKAEDRAQRRQHPQMPGKGVRDSGREREGEGARSLQASPLVPPEILRGMPSQ